MHGIKQYSVNLLFNEDGSKILLQKKDRTLFAGKLNGVGGKIEDGENPAEGALREIMEEASIHRKDISCFSWIGTLTLPEQCDMSNADKYPELWFFAGIVKDEHLARKPEMETEEIGWYMLGSDGRPFTTLETAGDGNLEYFIRRARKQLFGGQAAFYEMDDEL